MKNERNRNDPKWATLGIVTHTYETAHDPTRKHDGKENNIWMNVSEPVRSLNHIWFRDIFMGRLRIQNKFLHNRSLQQDGAEGGTEVAELR